MDNNILDQSGEYIVITTKEPYVNVMSFTNINEDIVDMGIGTMYKKEFRYSLDGNIYSEYQELSIDFLKKLGSFEMVYFQFRYILLAGGPLKVNNITLDYISFENDNQVKLDVSSDSLYTYKSIYKSGCTFEPYKVDKAISLFKDLNLMANDLFGIDVYYYKIDPNKKHQDVILQEYTLYDYQDKKLMKIVIPENNIPQPALNVNPFGIDFELPFEIHIHKDYFQKIFGDGTGPQKKDIVYFPLTNRIYEVASSVMYNDFMYTPIYFKVQLVKWQPKINTEKNDDIKTLESYTIKSDELFLDETNIELKDTTNEQQFNIKTTTSDIVRSFIDNDMKIYDYAIVNYYTVISEYYYNLESTLKENIIKLHIDNITFKKNKKYYTRLNRNNNNITYEMKSSMKILTNLNENIFSYSNGNSIYEKNYYICDIFNNNSQFSIYENEYNEFENDKLITACNIPASFVRNKAIEYTFANDFNKNKDIAYSSWFKLNECKSYKYDITEFNYDNYLYKLKIKTNKKMNCLIDDDVIIKRKSDSNFLIFGKIISISSQSNIMEYEIDVNKEIYDTMMLLFPSWQNYTDLYISKYYTSNLICSYDYNNKKGISIDIIDNKFVVCTLNDKKYYTYLKDTVNYDKWYSIFINVSNLFKKLGINIWKIQWDPKTNEPKSTRLKLLVSNLVDIETEDRSTNIKYYINSSYMDITNIRLYNRTINTDKQDTILNQYVVQESHICDIIDNAEGQLRYPYVGSTR